ncbi:hypothetical protein MSAN_00983800 [Mycena sanguinolenta]|uniref:Uncharacterized protein n=1 Tax=Mycena sanguinolenta TaxID=230812 RepID=A0A8H6YR49_9AGAR|nr:hypothetical protein MSAN_00983800 [Mycena sanguinolenta]
MTTPITSFPSPNSPTMSSTSSFDVVSARSRSSTSSGLSFDDSDDEIVWGQSDGSLDSGLASDDDFVVLSRPRSPPTHNNDGADTPNNLVSDAVRRSLHEQVSSIVRTETATRKLHTLAAKKPRSRPVSQPHSPVECTTPVSERPPSSVTRTPSPSHKGGRRRRRNAKKSSPSPSPSPTQASVPTTSSLTSRNSPPVALSGGVRLGVKKVQSPSLGSNASTSSSPNPMALPASSSPALPSSKPPISPQSNDVVGFGARSIVDDVSERASECGNEDEPVSSAYDTAASYITSCLSNPSAVCRLTLLQSLIVEFGVVSSSMPVSLSKARSILKSRVFVNIGEYLVARERGPQAVQEIIHPSRRALIRDLRQKRNRVPRHLVKEAGLSVLLVSF